MHFYDVRIKLLDAKGLVIKFPLKGLPNSNATNGGDTLDPECKPHIVDRKTIRFNAPGHGSASESIAKALNPYREQMLQRTDDPRGTVFRYAGLLILGDHKPTERQVHAASHVIGNASTEVIDAALNEAWFGLARSIAVGCYKEEIES